MSGADTPPEHASRGASAAPPCLAAPLRACRAHPGQTAVHGEDSSRGTRRARLRPSGVRRVPLGHLRFAMESIRPEAQQYVVERNVDGVPFDRDTRSIVYERSKGTDGEDPFSSELELERPGIGGVLPGAEVDREIAAVRGVPERRTVISPPYHRVHRTPRELVRFLDHMREPSGGEPVGFKLCVGSRRGLLAVCKAMLEEDITPDFIVVDGAEGGTGAAPLEFADAVGLPLTEGLTTVHRALVGAGLRDRIRIGASGRVATGSDIVKRPIQGADHTNSARAMMFALGCIPAQRCHTNTCPVGVASQDRGRSHALDVKDKARRVQRFQEATVKSALQIMAAMGVDDPSGLKPGMLLHRVWPNAVRSHAELYAPLEPGRLLSAASIPAAWAGDWNTAHPDRFTLS
ncbi:glutamate synthase-related protein [Streptomyces sp. NPDC059556]|uniref:glutamate synthase-related protein n=1 Tax=Streptomyces sp. NPDC059556 TaxID=3346863 RepID=UPI0036BD8C29